MNAERRRLRRERREMRRAQRPQPVPNRRGNLVFRSFLYARQWIGQRQWRTFLLGQERRARAENAQRITMVTLDARRAGRERAKPSRRKAFLNRIAERGE